MAVILDISASVPEATIRDFARACNRYRDELGNSQKVAMRRGTIALIKSLRALTPRAKKQLPLRNIRRADPSETYSYYTPKGKKKAFPRWLIVRRNGKAYYKPSVTKDFFTPVKSRSEARKKWGQIKRWGLAKKSWGWFMQALFNRSNPESKNPDAKIDRRMVDCKPIRVVGFGENTRIEVVITNKLKFMSDILPSGALNEAMQSATNSINEQINKGMAKARKELT